MKRPLETDQENKVSLQRVALVGLGQSPRGNSGKVQMAGAEGRKEGRPARWPTLSAHGARTVKTVRQASWAG